MFAAVLSGALVRNRSHCSAVYAGLIVKFLPSRPHMNCYSHFREGTDNSAGARSLQRGTGADPSLWCVCDLQSLLASTTRFSESTPFGSAPFFGVLPDILLAQQQPLWFSSSPCGWFSSSPFWARVLLK
jgi:hypothetical protein